MWKYKNFDKMKNKLNYNNIEELLNNLPDNFKILEETIDVEVQKDFFESAQNLDFNTTATDIKALINELNDKSTAIPDIKIVLQKLSMTDSIESFRAIEAFQKDVTEELNDWTILALQQSQMIIQSSLLDEQQVFISTGLGGKNNRLRYFLIFPFVSLIEINDIQKEILEKELGFFLNQYSGQLEKIEFHNGYATAFALIPLDMKASEMIKDILSECNQYGQYLTDDVIITNIKKFNHEEILDILKKYERHQNTISK